MKVFSNLNFTANIINASNEMGLRHHLLNLCGEISDIIFSFYFKHFFFVPSSLWCLLMCHTAHIACHLPFRICTNMDLLFGLPSSLQMPYWNWQLIFNSFTYWFQPHKFWWLPPMLRRLRRSWSAERALSMKSEYHPSLSDGWEHYKPHRYMSSQGRQTGYSGTGLVHLDTQ